MIAILTDSTCDIPQELVEKYHITIVPQYVIWGEEQFRDRVDLQPETFYARLEAGDQRPTTSQATELDFLQAIEIAIDQGADEVIILTVSSAMSGTYQMAVNAGEKAKVRVAVIDSKGPTMTLGWQVLVAARARDEGKSVDEIVQLVGEVRSKMVQIVGMETLEYLQTGGRIGDAAKWVGTLLKVRPVVSINHQTGRVQPIGLARTHKAMVNMLYRKFFDGLSSHKNLRIAVLHGGALEEAQALVERIRAEFDPIEIILNITGPVLGINTGPGALALCGYSED
jgi:DegV family protein with EDD domain